MRISGQSILAYMQPAAAAEKGDPYVFQGLAPPGDADMALGYSFLIC